MRVHLIKKQSIEEFVRNHARSKTSFEDWLQRVKHADWRFPGDIQESFSTADFLGNASRRVVFDVGGNNYRIICKYVFGEASVRIYVCWIGTHADYTYLCRRGHQYTVNQF
ncbi:type II toxin-antitoxin system HigB family toxin [Dyadobacter sp. CY323]|uniref:type II toxin-antitoxin system HigB family toxin n=1 Tax=Dyadobacter sp. CY323 TaxID=2907302 RepID=UPI001F475679|nr:type II toxin-antitoxin system HigB family toxin [Dyadobacter sp. CY323]MCE6990546.1 type II toxin-antitoxin system HigB family toxin [Dyadobacter sp. CY323]